MYKNTFEYRRRLVNALVVSVAAFFVSLADSQRLSFKLKDFYLHSFNAKDINLTEDQFNQEVRKLSGNSLFNSGILPKETRFDEILAIFQQKPLVGQHLASLNITTVLQLFERFGRVDKATNSVVIKTIDVYKHILDKYNINSDKVDYDSLLRAGVLHIAVAINALYKRK